MSIKLVFELPAHKEDGKQSLLKTRFDKNALFRGLNKINIVMQKNLFKVRLMCLSDQHCFISSECHRGTQAAPVSSSQDKCFSSRDSLHIPRAVHAALS